MQTAMSTEKDKQWLEHFKLTRYYREAEQDVRLHKWFRSEQAGHDVGWDEAIVDWTLKIAGNYYEGHPTNEKVASGQ